MNSIELILFRVIVRLSGVVPLTETVWVTLKVSRGRSDVKAAAVGLVSVMTSLSLLFQVTATSV